MSPIGDYTKEPAMTLRNRPRILASAFLIALLAARHARADPTAAPTPEPARLHGPEAPDGQFPSHVFQLDAHAPKRAQIGFTFGLSQPILAHGFNAAIDVRYGRLVLTYSHGQGLDVTPALSSNERAAGMTLQEPFTTGGGAGIVLIDELWILADVKVHHFVADTPVDHRTYTNVTVGVELGWRFFVWKGFNIDLVARYWPQVYSSAGQGITLHDANGRPFLHHPMAQGIDGFVPNVLLGWAFDL
jgi:hypothetical protein